MLDLFLHGHGSNTERSTYTYTSIVAVLRDRILTSWSPQQGTPSRLEFTPARVRGEARATSDCDYSGGDAGGSVVTRKMKLVSDMRRVD